MQRFLALLFKEFRQMRRDKRVIFISIAAPFLELLIFGYALSATVTNLPLGVLDESRTPESRAFVSALTQSQSFVLAGYYTAPAALHQAIARGTLDAGVVIPREYARDVTARRTATIQFLLNATNANIAAIAQGYAAGIVQAYNAQLMPRAADRNEPVSLMPVFYENPGLVGSWFMVTGVLGMLFILNGSMLSTTMMSKERTAGTIEQLLMSPATTGEIIVAKIIPLFTLFAAMGLLSLAAIRFIFGVPFHGSLAIVAAGAIMCMLSGIALGMFISTVAKSALQAQLTVFFINPPLASVSGAFTPIEAMPKWMQPLTNLNPLAHFAIITRSALIENSGFDALWRDFAALFVFTAVLLTLSVMRYRRQLA